LKFFVSQNFKQKKHKKVYFKKVGELVFPSWIFKKKNQLQKIWIFFFFFFFLSHDLEGQKAIARSLENRFVTGFQSIFHQLQNS